MTDPIQAIMQQAGLKVNAFSPGSRYYSIETAILERPGKEPAIYVRRRFIPPADRFSLLQEHTVTDSERLDNISFQYLGDPEQFWRLCDANNTMNPEELEEPGAKIRITLPEGIPGTPNG